MSKERENMEKINYLKYRIKTLDDKQAGLNSGDDFNVIVNLDHTGRCF